MIKKTVILWLFLLLFPLKAAAADLDQLQEEQLKNSGFYTLFDELPSESNALFPEDFNAGHLSSLKLQDLLSYLKDLVTGGDDSSFRLFFTVVGTLLLAALIRALDAGGKMADFLSLAAAATVITPAMVKMIASAEETAELLHNFILKFLPIFAGICGASGKAFSAIAYESSVLAFTQLYSAVAEKVLLPMVGVFFALSVCGCLGDVFSTDGLTKGIKNLFGWILGGILTLFSILITAKTMIASTTDAAAIKATKFLAGSLIPVIGSSLNDAYATVFGCLDVVKSTIGVFGILAVLFAFLPPLISMVLSVFFLRCATVIGEILGENRAAKLLDSAGTALSLALGVVFAYEIMAVISITVMLMTGGSG